MFAREESTRESEIDIKDDLRSLAKEQQIQACLKTKPSKLQALKAQLDFRKY